MKNATLVFIALIALALTSCNTHPAKTEEKTEATPKTVSLKIADLATNQDMVCGMKMEEGHIGDTTVYQGKIYGFCSPECKAEFVKDPQSHLTQK